MHMFYFLQILFVMSLSFNEQLFKENIFSGTSRVLPIEVKFKIASIEQEKTNKQMKYEIYIKCIQISIYNDK